MFFGICLDLFFFEERRIRFGPRNIFSGGVTCFLDLTVQRGGLGVHVPTDAKGRMSFGAGNLFSGPAHMFSGPRCVPPGPRVKEQGCRHKYVLFGPFREACHIFLDTTQSV